MERRGDQRAVPAGEAQRRGRRTPGARTYPAPGKLERLDQFSGWLYAGQKIGHAGLVTAAAGPHYESVIADMAEQLGDGSRTPQDAVDKYYLRVRMRRWFGTLIEVDRRNRVLGARRPRGRMARLYGDADGAPNWVRGHQPRSDGAVVEIDPAGTIDLYRSSRAAWRLYAGELAADPHTALDGARAEMTTAIRMALRDPATQGCLGLTGGKDSRLILALLLADGVASDLEYQTVGADDLPDVVVARQLASMFGLRHVTRPGVAERWAWRQCVDTAVRESNLPDSPLARDRLPDHGVGDLRHAQRR